MKRKAQLAQRLDEIDQGRKDDNNDDSKMSLASESILRCAATLCLVARSS